MTGIERQLAASLLAEGAATADRAAGPCPLCGRVIGRGHRYAVLVPDGRAAHVACIGMTAAMLRRRSLTRFR